ncbi:MAG: hypothetical protein OHK0045_22660 [Raineya sp.]
MRRGTKLKLDKKIKIAKAICEKYATGNYTFESCCNNEGISENTLYAWAREFEGIEALLKDAQRQKDESFKKSLKEKAKTSLEKLIEGFESVETYQEGLPGKDGKITTTKVTTKKRFIGPNVTAVIFALTNVDSENFKHKAETEHKGKIEIDNLSKLTDEELEFRIRELQNKVKK